MKDFLKTTIVGGVRFLLPVALVPAHIAVGQGVPDFHCLRANGLVSLR